MQYALEDMPYLMRAFFAALATLWLWMFFPPMHKLGLVYGTNTFIPFLIALLIAQWIPFVWARVIIAIVAAQTYIVYYFHPITGIGHGIVPILHEEISQVGILVRTGRLVEPFQTHLFLFALILIYWLLAYASRRPRLWLFYNGLGILVLAIIDGNTNVHPNLALVVNCLIAFAALGLSRYAQLRLHFEQFRWPAARYLGPLAAVILVASAMAFVLPKAPAVWADPFKSLGIGPGSSGSGSGNGSGGATQHIGYQESNAKLGGSFVMDYQPVLSVDTKTPLYLRGKVYSTYTGKGWISGSASYTSINGGDVYVGQNAMLTSSTPTKSVTQTIEVLSNRLSGDSVFGAYSVSQMKPDTPANPGPLQVNLNNGDIVGPWNQQGNKYTVVSKAIEDPSAILKKLSPLPTSVSARTNFFVHDVGPAYLQLPGELPKRVGQLAQKLVKGDTTEYQMVQDIEGYLQGFQYQITGVPTPGKNQDYVDQFLFESQVGYCNNFSSSLAVMLRTLGIPTRWVTGFADGQNPDSTAPDTNTSGTKYIIRESDAHSWVEVYFPKYGWIPFDPTPGFSFPYLAAPNPSSGSTQSSTPTPPQKSTKSTTPQKSSASAGGGLAIPWQAIWSWTWKIVTGIVGLSLLLSVLFRKRALLRLYMWLWRHDTPGALTRSILRLMGLLKRKGWIAQRETTIRDLEAAAARSGIPRDEFLSLVRTVERTWYSQDVPSTAEVKQVHKTWIQWIRAVIFGKAARKGKAIEEE